MAAPVSWAHPTGPRAMTTYPAVATAGARALVACFGTVLSGDDGFGSVVAKLLGLEGVPPDVRVVDVGIGGMDVMVRALRDPYEVLVIVATLDVGRPPGTVVVFAPDVDELMDRTPRPHRAGLTAARQQAPDRTASDRTARVTHAGGVIPSQTWLVGCQPSDTDAGAGLTPPVERAVTVAAAEVHRVIDGTTTAIRPSAPALVDGIDAVIRADDAPG